MKRLTPEQTAEASRALSKATRASISFLGGVGVGHAIMDEENRVKFKDVAKASLIGAAMTPVLYHFRVKKYRPWETAVTSLIGAGMGAGSYSVGKYTTDYIAANLKKQLNNNTNTQNINT